MVKAALAVMLVAAALQPVFRTDTELVLVNVVVRDKAGAVVRGLKQTDFVVLEDGRPQTVTTFDFEEPDRAEAGLPPG